MVAEIHALASDGDADDISSSVLRLTRKKERERQRRIVVFYIDDEAYTVPAKPGAEISLKALDILAERGEGAAIHYMMKAMLGEDGYSALMTYQDLPPDALAQVMKKIQEIANAPLEGPKAS